VTYADIYGEVAALRFNTQTTKLAQVKKWVGQAEIAVWNAANWSFKRMPPTDLAVVAGDNTPTMPADFGKAHRLYDYLGDPVTYYAPDEFFLRNEADIVNGNRGEPTEYTVVNRQIQLAPIPQTSRTFKASYRRRYSHLNAALTTVAGVMSVDTDTPIWDSEFHYILVPWAMILGEKLEADPTANDLRQERDEMLARMVAELVGGEVNELRFWGGS
jgi:hypothetical protein